MFNTHILCDVLIYAAHLSSEVQVAFQGTTAHGIRTLKALKLPMHQGTILVVPAADAEGIFVHLDHVAACTHTMA